jgi:hypothetical protein
MILKMNRLMGLFGAGTFLFSVLCGCLFEKENQTLFSENCPEVSTTRGEPDLYKAAQEEIQSRITETVLEGRFTERHNSWMERDPQCVFVPGDPSFIAWNNADGNLHVTQIMGGLPPTDLVVLDGHTLGGFTLTPQGFALLAVQGYRVQGADGFFNPLVYVMGYDETGAQQFQTVVMGEGDPAVEGTKYDPLGYGNGRLLFGDGKLAVYLAHMQNTGGGEAHEGDLLWFYDLAGNKLETQENGGWDWGLSHSMDLRLLFDGTNFLTGGLTDAYPTPEGVKFKWAVASGDERNWKRIFDYGVVYTPEWGWLGGMTITEGGYIMTYATGMTRSAFDVGFSYFDKDGTIHTQTWLTERTSQEEETHEVRNINHANYGEHYLVAWMVSNKETRYADHSVNVEQTPWMAVVNRDGEIITGPETVTTGFTQADDFVNYPNGDVGWVYGQGNPCIGPQECQGTQALTIVRVGLPGASTGVIMHRDGGEDCE